MTEFASTAPAFFRVPESRFKALPDFHYPPRYLENIDGFGPLRMAYIDESPTAISNGRVALCLHGEPSWGFLYRKMIKPFLAAGYRVVVPDLFGFGRSDKPLDESWYSFDAHRSALLKFVVALDLNHITLVVQDWGGLLGLTLPPEMPDRFEQLLVMNTTLGTGDVKLSQGFINWRNYMAAQTSFSCSKLFKRACPHLSDAELLAYDAPYGDDQAQESLGLGGVKRFPALVPEFANSPGADISRLARDFWRERWQGSSFMAIGMQDPVLGEPVMQNLRQNIRNCPEPMLIAAGGHFLQEWETGDGTVGSSIVATALHSWK